MPNPEHVPDSTESRALSRATWGATAGVFLSRISGIFRMQIVNALFGAGFALDAFNAAQRLPNSLRDLFAEGALSSAFTKTLMIAKENGVHDERRVIALTTGFFGCVTLI